jgi:hypothetical protein
VARKVDRVVVAGAELGEQPRARRVAASDRGDARTFHLGQHRGHALAFLDCARQVAGRVDDEQHVELARAPALLAPLGDRHAFGGVEA